MNYILLTGVAGFIGSHTAARLLHDKNNIIIGIDNLDPYYDLSLKEANLALFKNESRFIFYKMDILDKDALKTLFDQYQFQVIIHLAAMAGVRNSFEQPLKYHRVNVTGTNNLLELASLHGVKKLVIASSSSVYGNNKKVPFNEDDELSNIISPYAQSKRDMEIMCLNKYQELDLSIVLLRFFTVYGPRMRPDLAIAKFMKAINHHDFIEQYGDGSTKRDYTYIDDIVSGILLSMNYVLTHNHICEIINLGDSHAVSLKEMIQTIETVTNKKMLIHHVKMQKGDVEQTFADISKAIKLLDYQVTTPLKVGLEAYYQWFKEIKE